MHFIFKLDVSRFYTSGRENHHLI